MYAFSPQNDALDISFDRLSILLVWWNIRSDDDDDDDDVFIQGIQ